MNVFSNEIAFSQNDRVITVNGSEVINLKHVPEKAKAIIYSKVDSEYSGCETSLAFENSRSPFDFTFFKLTPAGLIAAVKENRLEIDGMIIHETLDEAYAHLWHDRKKC